ncbi:hypothetical protein [Streptomyces sp. RerS4]|uniref:hypothetical protein n=1 Tax=Streptomyces sp. RerS4 TaxID=2942449 RepID=UPI00201BE4AB|nr:hypothetical protein [Streptomyces sp. RerS4]UQW99139.1 hypothetical protein M4D82_00230 [Streptomyces sp. RerS4]
MKLAVRLSVALRSHWQTIKDQEKDRGDISITTIIIWVAAVAGALVIAGTIGVVVTKYNGKLSGI